MAIKRFNILPLTLLSLGLTHTPAVAGIGKVHHVNIVSFQKDDEVKIAAQ